MRKVQALVLAVVGMLTLSACDFSVYDLPLPGGTSTGDNPMTITVEFADVLDLVPQSQVQVNDVPVGEVTAVDLDGQQAVVTLEVKNDVDLPDNARAEIRQTSLLGEKFVELKAPDQGGQGKLEDGETIPIERAGRNPEVEEVFGALSLVLNGGGIAQVKTISVELSNALEGREGSARSVLTQLRRLTGNLDSRKQDIVDAIESLDRLARSANKQEDTINATLEELPSAIKSIDGQREDLVKMLKSLDRLSGVGIRVINASKDSTIATLRRLDPVLTQLANAGDDFVNAFSVFLTYPFVDETVGRDPQVARNIKFGDYTNLAIKLDVDLVSLLQNPPSLDTACVAVDAVTGALKNGGLDLKDILGADAGKYCKGVTKAAQRCLNAAGDRKLNACTRLLGELTGPLKKQLCKQPGLQNVTVLCPKSKKNNNGPKLPGVKVPKIPSVTGSGGGGGSLLGNSSPLNRAPFVADRGGGGAGARSSSRPTLGEMDPDLVRLLVPGVLAR